LKEILVATGLRVFKNRQIKFSPNFLKIEFLVERIKKEELLEFGVNEVSNLN